jgi:phage shock protein A
MQAPLAKAMIDVVVAQAEQQQLRTRYDAVLSDRERRDRRVRVAFS